MVKLIAGRCGHQDPVARGLQHGVETLCLCGGVSLHLQTLMEYDGRGRCGLVVCWDDTRDTYLEEMKTWAVGVDWDLSDNGEH